MTAAWMGTSDSYAQFLAVLVIFVLVLALTYAVTRWIARYQKVQSVNCNIEVVETTRISNNKYIQIVRIGETYVAIAVCKDTVCTLCEVPAEQIKELKTAGAQIPFGELFARAMKKHSGKDDGTEGFTDDEK